MIHMQRILIVDYGMANLRSVQKAFEKVGAAAEITGDPNRLGEADKLILPGVGAFRDAIARLRDSGLDAPIRAHVRAGKPFFGICLGLQLLFSKSYEDGEYEGLDLFPGDVVRFRHVPGLKVVMPSTPADAKGLLKSSVRDNNTVIFIESEVLYGTRGEVPEGEYLTPLGVAEVKRPGRDVTVIAHSKMVHVALDAGRALEKEGIEIEVVDPRTLRPLDTETILNSVRKTNRVVIVEEGWPFCGVGAQIVDTIQLHAFDFLDSPILRVTGVDVPMPYAKNLEHLCLPDTARVMDAVHQVLYRK